MEAFNIIKPLELTAAQPCELHADAGGRRLNARSFDSFPSWLS